MTELSTDAKFERVPPGKPFLQIINTGAHWLVVAFSPESNELRVYDSLPYTLGKRQRVEACISALVRSPKDELTYIVPACQEQEGADDCGLFAAAFLTDLALGNDPSLIVYDQKLLRHHMAQCFKDAEIRPFPQLRMDVEALPPAVYQVKLYCDCRRAAFLQSKSKDWIMVQCDKCKTWYHQMCIKTKIPRKKEQKWFCHHCVA